MITGLLLDNTGAPGVTFPRDYTVFEVKNHLHPAQHRTAGVTLPVCYWFLSEGWKRSALGNSQMKSLDSACGSKHRILLKQERRAPGWSRTCHPTIATGEGVRMLKCLLHPGVQSSSPAWGPQRGDHSFLLLWRRPSCRNGPVIRSSGYSQRGSKVSSQHSHSGSRWHMTLVQGIKHVYVWRKSLVTEGLSKQ